MKVLLITCQFISSIYNQHPANLVWCGKSGCLIQTEIKELTKTGNIWLPENCFKRIK